MKYGLTKKTVKWDEVRVGIMILVVFLVIGFALASTKIYILSGVKDSISKVNEVVASLEFSMMGTILSILVRVWIKLNDAHKSISQTSDTTRLIANASADESREYRKRRHIETYNELVRNTVNRLMFLHLGSIRTSKNFISVDTRNTAVYFNTQFWEELRAYQEALASPFKPPNVPVNKIVSVNITHLANIEFWERYDAQQSLQMQRSFIESGGRITRIIEGALPYEEIYCNNDSLKKAVIGNASVRSYRKIVSQMEKYRIEVKYIQRDDFLISRNVDFAIINMEENSTNPDIAMVWYLDHDVIIKCNLLIDNRGVDDEDSETYLESESVQSLSRRWEELCEIHNEQECQRVVSSG